MKIYFELIESIESKCKFVIVCSIAFLLIGVFAWCYCVSSIISQSDIDLRSGDTYEDEPDIGSKTWNQEYQKLDYDIPEAMERKAFIEWACTPLGIELRNADGIQFARYALTEYQRDIVERVVMAESGNQDMDGQMLVAQCILNTAEARDMNPDAVVLEKNQYASPHSFASDSVKEAVSRVFDDGEMVTNEPIRWFYAPRYCAGTWHESKLVFVLEHGGHRFFKAYNT